MKLKCFLRRFFLLLLMCFGVLGFERNFQMLRWEGVSKSNPILYLRPTDDFIENLNVGWMDLDIEDPISLLFGRELNQALIWRVAEQFNAINTSYLKMLPYGETLPGVLETFDEGATKNRVIEIKLKKFSNPFIGGEAQSFYEKGKVTRCVISLDKTRPYSAKEFLHLLVHETAHCVGLGHVHGDPHSVLAYDAPFDNYFLSQDEKAGVTTLYPSESRYEKRSQTFGLASCAKMME